MGIVVPECSEIVTITFYSSKSDTSSSTKEPPMIQVSFYKCLLRYLMISNNLMIRQAADVAKELYLFTNEPYVPKKSHKCQQIIKYYDVGTGS